MPRKTDGIKFEIHPRPTKGEDGKPLLYVRLAKRANIRACGRCVKAAAGSTSLKRIVPQNKTRFRPTAPTYQGGCSKT